MAKKHKNRAVKQEVNVMNETIDVQDAIEVEVEEIKEVEEETGKKKWPLKKTLLVAGGAVAGLVLGALVLGKKSDTTIAEDRLDGYNSDDPSDDSNADDEDEEIPNNSETE